MVTRRSEIIKGPRSYWGTERTSGAESIRSEPPLRVRCSSGAIMETQLFAGAVAVIRGNARIIDKRKRGRNKPVPTIKVVICGRKSSHGAVEKLSVGIPIEAIDPGRKNSYLVLPKGTESSPVIAKSMCRLVGKCTDADINESCGRCCNKKKLNGGRKTL